MLVVQKLIFMKYLYILTLVFVCQISLGQSRFNDLAVELGWVSLPIPKKQKSAFVVSAKYYFMESVSAGLSFSITRNSYNEGFGYPTNYTLLNMYKVEIPFQYDIIDNEKFSLGLGFGTGVLFNVLRNKEVLEEVEYYDEWGVTQYYVPQKIRTDHYMSISPYAQFSYKIAPMDRMETAHLYLTGSVGYQNAYGKGKFSNPRDFSNYLLSFGLIIKGTLD